MANQETEDLKFGTEEALIRYILKNISTENKSIASRERIEIILDELYDYYFQNSFLDEEKNTHVEIEEKDLIEFISNNLKEKPFGITPFFIEEVLDLEYQYNKTNGLFD